MTCVEYKTFKLNTFCILYLIVIIDICVSLLLTKLCSVCRLFWVFKGMAGMGES